MTAIDMERGTNWGHALFIVLLMAAGVGCLVMFALTVPRVPAGFWLLGFCASVALLALHSGAGEMETTVDDAPEVAPIAHLHCVYCLAEVSRVEWLANDGACQTCVRGEAA